MSCCNNSNDFSNLGDTWTKKSSLTLQSNYYPFPSLQDPKNCYNSNGTDLNKEKYCHCTYGNGLNINNPAASSSDYTVGSLNTLEKYHCCSANPYHNLNTTWGVQKPFTL
jgi:hypothetical protein